MQYFAIIICFYIISQNTTYKFFKPKHLTRTHWVLVSINMDFKVKATGNNVESLHPCPSQLMFCYEFIYGLQAIMQFTYTNLYANIFL